MRNSFEDMKKFIAQQDELLMETSDKQHDRTQRAIGGPRPQPTSSPRTPRQAPGGDDDEDMRSKRKNLFKRALKGLSLKNTNDLSKIEDMLVKLLLEVEALRAAQDGKPQSQGNFTNSNDDVQHSSQQTYENEGQATTASSAEDNTAPPPKQSNYAPDLTTTRSQRKDRRISPVIERDEDQETLEPHEQQILEHPLTSDPNLASRHRRGGSVPLSTPPRVPVASGALSTDTTPKKSSEKTRKHKSSSSSFFPKISRWSKTTASSVGENIRNSIQTARKERNSSEMSRSGSDLAQGVYNTADYYDPRGDDRLRSSSSLVRTQENRPPSPLVPSQVSENPKYQAHRNSLNLQHPQPRQGPTSRYQTYLESQAQTFGASMTPTSEPWASNLSLSAANNAGQRPVSNRQSPVSDGGYSFASSGHGQQNAPPRPPKIRDDGPLVPNRPPKVKEDGQPSYAEREVLRGSQPPELERVRYFFFFLFFFFLCSDR